MENLKYGTAIEQDSNPIQENFVAEKKVFTEPQKAKPWVEDEPNSGKARSGWNKGKRSPREFKGFMAQKG